MAVPTITNKKRKNSLSNNNTSHVNSKKKKSKNSNVTVKEELNIEIPSDVSAISTINAEASSSSSFSSLVLRDKNLPPISSLLLYKPIIADNRFDPFYQSIKHYAQYALPDFSDCPPTASVKQETGNNAAPVMPIIPYYFHHGRFGIEACMHQLEHHRQQKL